tara:strand:+ start:326 stop:472 length:147 start_codon:yes stop_codon:yes gene_type:complete
MELLMSLLFGVFIGWYLTVDAIYSLELRDLKKNKREYDKLIREIAEES